MREQSQEEKREKRQKRRQKRLRKIQRQEQRRQKRKQRRRGRKIAGILGVTLLFVLLAFPFFFYFLGRYQLNRAAFAADTGEDLLQEQINYKNCIRQRRSGVYTFLLLGVDIRQSDVDQGINSIGQSDAIMLAVLDTETKSVNILSFPRDIMVDNAYTDKDLRSQVQATLIYAYAGGGQAGCLAMEEAVSAACYGLPIHGYAELPLLAIPELNDAVGGVTVTMDEDLTVLNPAFVQGQTLLLQGDLATEYLHCRDIYQAQSSLGRTNRHKQYAAGYIRAFRSAWKKQPLLPLKLWNILKDYGACDLTAAEIWYLVWNFRDIALEDVSVCTLDVHVAKDGNYEEYYLEDSLVQKTLVDLLYE